MHRQMSKFLSLIILTCITSIGLAQNNAFENGDEKTEFEPIFLTYISLSSSFETYNSLDIGLMKDIGPKSAIGAEFGYIYNLEGLTQRIEENWYKDVYGVKAYFYYRFFLNIDNNYPANSKTFIDIEPQFYWTSFNAERIGGYSCNDEFGDCEYYKFFDSGVDRIVPGLNIKMGKIYDYDPFYITLFAGLGYRHIYEFSEMYNNNVLPDKTFNKGGEISELQTGGILKLRLGLQLAYNIWR